MKTTQHLRLLLMVSGALLTGVSVLQPADLATRAAAGSMSAAPVSVLATITVNDAGDTAIGGDGKCTLREAITNANLNSQRPGSIAGDCAAGTAGLDNIEFNLGSGTPTINVVGTALPTVTEPININGNTGGATRIELNGAGAGAVSGLFISGGNSIVSSLVINRFSNEGLIISTNGGNTVKNCYIGTDASGTIDLGNARNGLVITSSNNTIGGTTTSERNLISGNNLLGVWIINTSASGNKVIGNYIGVDVTGAADLGNIADGLRIEAAPSNTIGGTTAGERNIISGNDQFGVSIFNSFTVASGNKVTGNYIGVDASGALDLGNGSSGVGIFATDVTIGGTTEGERNLISGNNQHGVVISGGGSNGNNNKVIGNYIGSDASGALEVGNSLNGVRIEITSSNNMIGGQSPGASNLIFGNDSIGIAITGTNCTGNAIIGNSIFSNTGLGIDLGSNGVTANDAGDGDTGPNNLQNFPVLTSTINNGAGVSVVGSLNSVASSTFTIQFFSNPVCDSSGNGEGQVFLSQTMATTNSSGNAIINATLPAVTIGHVITATATDSANNTSEFSQCRAATLCPMINVGPTNLANGFVGVSYNQMLTASGGVGPYSFSVSGGSLPAGLNLTSAGVLSGSPLSSGNSNFTITATDNNGCSGERAYTLIVSGDGPGSLMYYALPFPIRLLDTRPGESGCTTPGVPLIGGQSLTLPAHVTCQGLTIPANAAAVVGNATVVNFLSGPGFITLYPSDAPQPTVSNLNYLSNQIVPNAFTVGLGADGAFNIFATTTTHFIVDITGYFAPPGSAGLYYHPLPNPVRLLDTRPGAPGCTTPGLPLVGGQSLTQQARLTCGGVTIPSGATAIVGNATVVNFLSGPGFITLFPTGASQPTVSNLNYLADQIIPNAFTVGLSGNGEFEIFATGATHFIVDVTGYYSNDPTLSATNTVGLLYHPLSKPIRLLDTRPGESGCTTPGIPLIGGESLMQQARVTCDGVTIPANAQAVVGNGTVVNFLSGPGFITLFPSDAPQPTVSNLNYLSFQIIPNAFTVSLGSDGAFKIFATTTTHFIADLTGYFAP